MRKSIEIDYIKNELKSYNYLQQRALELRCELNDRIDDIDDQLLRVRIELNEASAKSPGYEEIQHNGSGKTDKVLALIIREQKLEEDIASINDKYQRLLKPILDRIENINHLLSVLDEDEENIISSLYFEGMGYKEACEKYSYSRKGMYKFVVKIINKMIKKQIKNAKKVVEN